MAEAEDAYSAGWDDPNADGPTGAPIFEVPPRRIVAIEHPCVLLNLDKGLHSFGLEPKFQKLLAATREPVAVPLWFRPDNPTAKPIVSHHAATNNILLKITVPKRTGRKRKRGSNDPFTGDMYIADGSGAISDTDQLSSVSRRDIPKSVLRKLQDNAADYQVEAVGTVQDSYRYRGLADFQFANSSSSFLTKAAEHLLPMNVSKLREFKFNPGVAVGPDQEIIPPPHFTDKVIGFNYNYEQNPTIKVGGVDEIGEPQLVNTQGRKKLSYGHFIHHDTFPVPTRPRRDPDENYRVPDDLMKQLHEAMEERPIWTRRAILNRIHGDYTESLLKVAIQLVGYQFRGGPWRDAVVKYGLDPRSDPKWRFYQTLAFKLARNTVGAMKVPWATIRKGQMQKHPRGNRDSHLFDGESYSTDGKFWQICDVTDPFLVRLIEKAPLRPTCDLDDSGWYYKGTWAKIKTIMKVKMMAIKNGKMGSDDDAPQKPGHIYNSFLLDRLQYWPDITDKPLALTLEPFLRPMEEADGRRVIRRAPQTLYSKQMAGSTLPEVVEEAPASPGGEELDNWDSDGMFSEDDDVSDADEGTETAWQGTMDNDFDDDDAAEDVGEYDDEGQESDEGEEVEDEDIEGEDEDEIEQEDDDTAMDDGAEEDVYDGAD
ncbi:hypothetical protein F5B20DRAFT_173557 [Whalleya microplaca]|nr:hypothetical protein F5B20DRAFT_173557 [Whalleya microplaca]